HVRGGRRSGRILVLVHPRHGRLCWRYGPVTTTDETHGAAATVRIEDAGGGVRVLRLTNAARRNAIDRVSRAELAAAVAAIAADHEARALVVTGDGPSFCAGADLVDLFG